MRAIRQRRRAVPAAPAAPGAACGKGRVPGDSIPIGTVYNIFHEEYATDADFFRQVDADIPAIAAAGFDTVMVFPMSQWDPATKGLRWVRTDHLIGRIEEAGLKLVPILLKEAQCGHWFPIWMFKETGLWDALNRDVGNPNGREDVDFADPLLFPLLEAYFEAVIKRYGSSPALSFYNIWNEPHYHSTAPHVIERFRGWLKEKYGSLAALRRAFGEDYTDWSEVTPFINDLWNSSMPGIDWALFRNELQGILLGELAASLRRWDTVHPINANPVGTSFALFTPFVRYNIDNWQLTAHEDFGGASYYPDAWARTQGLPRAPLWFHNLSLGVFRDAAGPGGEYILTELYTNVRSGLTLGGHLDPATATQLMWTILANDCKGIITWKWQPFMRGEQSLGRGLVRLDGELAPRGVAVSEFAKTVRANGALLREARMRPPEVGVIVDMVGLLKTLQHTGEARTQPFMYESVAGVFRALDAANIPVDVLRADMGLTLERLRRYKVLFLPFQIVVRHALAPLLRAYVEAGGHLVADARTATIDELDFAYACNPGAGLDELFGARREDWTGTPGEHRVRIEDPTWGAGEIQGRYFREKLCVYAGASVVGVFPDTGEPALVDNRVGQGATLLAAVPLGASGFYSPESEVNDLLRRACLRAGAGPVADFETTSGSAPMIRVHERGEERIVYVIAPDELGSAGTLVMKPGISGGDVQITNLLTGAAAAATCEDGELRVPLVLGPLGVAVLHLAEMIASPPGVQEPADDPVRP